MAEGPFVKGITEKTKAEDGEGKSVTGSERVAIEEAGERLVVIFLAGNDARNIRYFRSYASMEIKVPFEHTHFQKVGLNAMARAESESREVSILEA